MNRLLKALIPAGLLTAALLGAAAEASAQVVIYRVEFKHKAGFNIDFFEQGYFVAPAVGGEGTFVLAGRDNGRKVLDSTGATGTLFVGLGPGGKRYTVVSAKGGSTGGSTTTATGTSTAGYMAYGAVTKLLTFSMPASVLRISVAPRLVGEALAAGDDGDATATTRDRNIGFAEISTLFLNFDSYRTERANDKGQDVAAATADMVTLLKRQGYVDSSSTSTDTGATTDTGTGTTTDTRTTN